MKLFVLIVLSCASALANAASHYEFSKPPGPHPVGFKVVQQYDYSRSSLPAIDLDTGKMRSGELARPIQTLIWYPASGGGRKLSYQDYVRTAATQSNFSLSEAQVEQATAIALSQDARGLSEAQRQAEMARPALARRDAAAASGKFPVLIYAPGRNGPAHENADMCEYLASQGYVVIASTSMGSRGRVVEITLEGAEAQAADIAFLIGYAHGMPQADMARIAVAGFSWGGLANVLAAARDQRIRALVSLDGSMRGYPEFINSGKDAAKYATPARVAVPLLYLSAQPKTIEEMEGKFDMSFSFINAMKYSDVYQFILHPMTHEYFGSEALRLKADEEFGEYSRKELMQAHGWASRYVLAFLNAYLKQDAKDLAFLKNPPTKNGVPPHMITADIRPAKRVAPTLEAFSIDLHAKGFAQAIPLYQAIRDAGDAFPASEEDLNNWGYRLMRAERPQDGLELFKLTVHLFPNSANAHDSLGEAYLTNKDKAKAAVHYRRSLELDPSNTNAEQALKTLGAAAPAAR